MVFENPGALWLLLALPPLLFGLGLFGWKMKKEALVIFPLNIRRLKRKQIEKYITSGVLMALLIITLGLPEITHYVSATSEKTGEIALLVDVSASMAAQKDLDSPSRLERVKPMLYDIIDSMEELGQVKISLYGFTSMARSHVPFVGKEDYPYLIESIKKVLEINSIPGEGTSIGKSVQDVTGKFFEGEQAKLIILFSDGEPFINGTAGMTYHEKGFIEQAAEQAVKEGIKVITVGVGEKEGAKNPIYNNDGKFTGDYVKLQGIDYISYLEDDSLKEIASKTGGEYFSEQNLGGIIDYIKANLAPVNSGETNKDVKVYQPIAQWFLLASLPVLIFVIRRHLLN
jgi:Ca-activated chloride channel family protein